MPALTKYTYSYPARFSLTEIVSDTNRNIEQPILSILFYLAEHKQTKKDTDNVKYLNQFKNDNGTESDGFYKYDLYVVEVNNIQYQVKIDIDNNGGDTVNVVITTFTFK